LMAAEHELVGASMPASSTVTSEPASLAGVTTVVVVLLHARERASVEKAKKRIDKRLAANFDDAERDHTIGRKSGGS
jgi:hypothetical protein